MCQRAGVRLSWDSSAQKLGGVNGPHRLNGTGRLMQKPGLRCPPSRLSDPLTKAREHRDKVNTVLCSGKASSCIGGSSTGKVAANGFRQKLHHHGRPEARTQQWPETEEPLSWPVWEEPAKEGDLIPVLTPGPKAIWV